ncbi:MAG: PEP-CTERM sorting domain-containing protein, partial [Candidatus Sulfotelmatobacter sp.]
IQGPGLSLSQALPLGPVLAIGYCYQGGVCNFGFTPLSSFDICGFCTGYSSGSLGSKTADYLDQNLRFTGGSAFYPIDGYTLLMHFTVAGTVTGYELVNCSGGIGCSLGPKEFTVQIFGQGTEEIYLTPYNFVAAVTGVGAAFSGTATVVPATVVPEPTSLVLTGTGLLWVWTKVNMRRANNCKS